LELLTRLVSLICACFAEALAQKGEVQEEVVDRHTVVEVEARHVAVVAVEV